MKLYGNLTNRIEENKNYNVDKMIHEGDDITMYYWSDRRCYYVTKVNSQKDIYVKEYLICRNLDEPTEAGDQDWVYFKDSDKFNTYVKQHGKDFSRKDTEEEHWVFRYNNWKLDLGNKKYSNLQPISFGVRNYYYDFEF